MFGKTFSHITQDLNKGYGLKSYFKILPKEDITNLKLYIKSLETASNEQIVFDRYLKQSSTTAQILGRRVYELRQQLNANKITQQEYNASVNSMIAAQQTATITTNVLKAALKTIANIGFALVINQIITGISNLVAQQENAKKAAQELSKQFNDDVSSIDNYILKISQLKKSLKDSNTLESERKNIKSDLLEIQNDLIKSYGFEADGLDIVNGKLEDNIQLMRNYLKEQYQDIYRKNSIGIEGSVNTLNTPRLSIIQEGGLYAINGIEALINPMHAVDVAGVNKQLNNIYKDLGIDKIELGIFPDDIYTLDKNLEEAQKRIEELMNQDELPNAIYKMYDDAYKYLGQVRKDQIEKIIKDNEENLESYIKGNEKYSDIYFDLFISKANYQEAIKSGDEKAIEEAAQSWVSAFDTAITKAAENGDGAVKSYFVNNFTFDDKSNEIANTAKKITYPVKESLSELNTQLEEVYNSFDTAFSNQSTIQSAFDKIQSGTDLTASEMRGLIKLCKKDFPEIGTLFTKTAKGYTISADNLIKANGAIMNSAKETVQSQINGYQDVINKYEEYQKKLSYVQDMSDMPDSVKQSQAKVLGITEEEYEAAKNELQNLLPLLDMFDISLSSTSESANAFSKAIEDSTKQITFIKSAMEEMSDNGYVSASTYQTLVEKGEKYVECLDLVNGKLVLNINKLKDLESQQLRSLIIDNNIRINKLNESLAHGANADAIRDETNAIRGQNAALEQQIEDIWSAEPTKSGSSKNDDPIKEAFEKEMKDIEHLHNMGLASDKEYYDALEKANEKHYKNSVDHESDYLSNIEKIYKGRQSLYKDDADKQFDNLDEQFKNGEITAERYAKALYDLGQSLYGKDSPYANTEFATKALEELDKKVKEVSDDIYSELKDSLSADGDRLLDDVLADADELSKKNIELFKNKGDLKTFKKNAEDIFKTVSASAKDALERGLITPERFKEIIDAYSQGLDSGIIQDIFDDGFDAIADKAKDNLDKMLITPDEYFKLLDEWGKKLNISEDVIKNLKEALSESDYLDRWDLDNGYDENKSKDDYELRAKRIEYIYELAEQLYGKNGQKNLKAYNALINQGLEDVESLVEDYYDEEIKKLEEINDKEKECQKALELQLNLIKARQKLEEAKNNRNQLVFHNGTFEYMADQDAVMSAGEDLAEAQKAILEQEREDQIKALEDQKAETLKFFNSVSGKLDDFIDRVKRFLSGNKDAFKVDEKDKTSDDFDSKMQKEWGLGNVDLTKRPKVKMDDGSIATVLSSGAFVRQGDEENGKYVYVHITPILPDGTVLSDEALDDCLYNTLEGSNNILETDKNGKRLVLKVDDNLGLSEEDIKSIESGNWTDNVKALVDKFDEWDIGLHNIQEQWLEQSQSTNTNSSNINDAESTDVSNIATAVTDIVNPILAFINSFGNGNAFENLVRALGGNPTAEGIKNFQDNYNATLVGKQIVPSTIDKIVNNNNSTTNNATKVINLGGIKVQMTLSVQSLEDFVENKIGDAMDLLGKAIEQKMPEIWAKA